MGGGYHWGGGGGAGNAERRTIYPFISSLKGPNYWVLGPSGNSSDKLEKLRAKGLGLRVERV